MDREEHPYSMNDTLRQKLAAIALTPAAELVFKRPALLGMGVAATALAPKLVDDARATYTRHEDNLMALRRDPTRTVTASLDAFLAKKAGQVKLGSDFSTAPWEALGEGVVGGVGSGLGKGLGQSIGETITGGIGAGVNALRDLLIRDRQRQTMLHSFMRSDPIIADSLERNPMNREVLTEAYGTMTRFAPTLSLDPNATRSFLREAVIGGAGVNYATIKNLVETENAINKPQGKR